MSKEKQIEEMRNILNRRCDMVTMAECAVTDCLHCTAKHLYEAGYRKQSEGEWEHVHSIKHVDIQSAAVVRCSECKMLFCDLINNHDVMYHFCPNCGAKMKGGEG